MRRSIVSQRPQTKPSLMRLSQKRVKGRQTQRTIFGINWALVTTTGTIALLTEM